MENTNKEAQSCPRGCGNITEHRLKDNLYSFYCPKCGLQGSSALSKEKATEKWNQIKIRRTQRERTQEKLDKDDYNCVECKSVNMDDFMVANSTWQEANMDSGRIHLSCLEQRLLKFSNRSFTLSDFPPDIPINSSIYFGYQLALENSKG